MGLIVDTSVLIAAERRRFDLGRLFKDNPKESFYIASITAAELLHGVERAQPAARRKARAAYVEGVLDSFEVIDFDLPVARRHATLWATLELSGSIIGAYDLLIAATGLQNEYAILTLNSSEFQRVEGLRLIDPAIYLLAKPQD
jgi:predicted nucleic acid-binding protein